MKDEDLMAYKKKKLIPNVISLELILDKFSHCRKHQQSLEKVNSVPRILPTWTLHAFDPTRLTPRSRKD